MKIAVTAVSGQLGGAIMNHLKNVAPAESLIGIARTPSKAEHLGVEIRQADYDSYDQFVTALQGVDRLLFVSGFEAPDKRIQQHRNIIEAARKCGVQKIVYTSIVGPDNDTTFNPIIQSNRQTEQDVQNSGIPWVIGRNGIYIDEDLVYMNTYRELGKIRNCAGDGKCAYTSRSELGYAYAQLLLNDQNENRLFHMTGPAITQRELADGLNKAYGTQLIFEDMTVKEYEQERVEELGAYLGTIIAGIYHGIRQGVFDVKSDFESAAGRPHMSLMEMIDTYEKENS